MLKSYQELDFLKAGEVSSKNRKLSKMTTNIKEQKKVGHLTFAKRNLQESKYLHNKILNLS